jgi:integrase
MVIDANPMLFVGNLRQRRPEIDPLMVEEVKRLISCASGQFKNLLTVLLFTGMRR